MKHRDLGRELGRERGTGRSVTIVAIAIAAVLGGLAAWFFAGKSAAFGPAAANRDLAPDTLMVYVELEDAAKVWDQVVASEAATDFMKSSTRLTFIKEAKLDETRSLLSEIASQAKFELSEANAKKLFGKNVAVGLEAAADGKSPHWLLLSKLDVPALAKDLLLGDTDFTKLHNAIDARTGMCSFTIAHADHRGLAISTATKGAQSFRFSVLGDTLVLSDNTELIERTIDAHLDGGKGSIGTSAAFKSDMAAVPADALVTEWYDFARMRAGRASVGVFLKECGATNPVPALDHFLSGSASVATAARATSLPSGNPYAMTWKWSFPAATQAGPVLSDCVLPKASVYAELRGLNELLLAWDRSSVAKRLSTGPMGEQIAKFMNDPESLMKTLPGGSSMPDFDEEFTDEGDEEPVAAEAPPPTAGAFEMKLGVHLYREVTTAFAGNKLAFAGSAEADHTFPFAAVARLDQGTELSLLALEAYAISEHGLVASEHAGHPVLSISKLGVDIRVAHANGHLIATSGDGIAHGVIDALTATTPPETSARTNALAAVPAEAQFVMWVDATALGNSLGALKLLPPAQAANAFGGVTSMTLATTVRGNFETIETRARAVVDPDALRPNIAGRAVPATWSMIPSDTWMHSGAAFDFAMLWRVIATTLPAESGDMQAQMSDAFRDAAKVDLETGFLPALGPEFAIAVTLGKRVVTAPGDEETPAIPGVLMFIEMKQPAMVRKVVDNLLATAQASADQSAAAQDRLATPLFARQTIGATDLIGLSSPELGMPFKPTLAFHGDFLVIALDRSSIDAVMATTSGKSSSVANAPYTKALAVEAPTSLSWGYMDWNAMLDQVAQYAPELGSFLPPDAAATDEADALPEPEFPDDPEDEAAMEAYFEAMQATQAKHREAGRKKVLEYIENARVIEYMGMGSRQDGLIEESTFIVRFAK